MKTFLVVSGIVVLVSIGGIIYLEWVGRKFLEDEAREFRDW